MYSLSYRSLRSLERDIKGADQRSTEKVRLSERELDFITTKRSVFKAFRPVFDAVCSFFLSPFHFSHVHSFLVTKRPNNVKKVNF